jgi:hypothetical protein
VRAFGYRSVGDVRLYLETTLFTLFNYYFDEDRDGHADTVALFEAIREGKHEAYTSQYAVNELEEAPEPKQSDMMDLIGEYGIVVLPITEESNHLANLYVSEGVIPARFRLDGAHIASASIKGLDCVLSYNFRHINRVKTKLLTERLNHDNGYGGVIICTAKEVLDDEQDDE